MNKFLERPKHETQPLGILFARILRWFSGLSQWSEEDQMDAGIYYGDQR